MKGKLVEYSTPINKTLFGLNEGEVFTRLGERYIFTRMKRGNRSFIATKISDGKSYSCYAYGAATSEVKVFGLWEKPVGANDIDKLKVGDLFVIDHRQKDCLLFQFVELTRSGKIKAKNPLTGVIWTLDKSYEIILVENIKKR